MVYVERNIKLLIDRYIYIYIENTQRTKCEYKLVNKIKVKVIENTLVITKVDKGKTLAILEKEDCHFKVHTFLQDNVCTKLSTLHLIHTRQHQHILCNCIITTVPKEEFWKFCGY